MRTQELEAMIDGIRDAPTETGVMGTDALRFVRTSEGRRLRLRGMNARVTKSGTVRVGDPISVRS
jgi:MOSC domain-containing protein YiiM